MKKKLIIAIVIVVVISSMVGINLWRTNNSENTTTGQPTYGSKNGQPVVAQFIETGEISASVLVQGIVKEVEEASVYSEQTLKIDQVRVEVGDLVVAGQELFTLDLSMLIDELEQMKLNYDIQTLQLKKLNEISSSGTSSAIAIQMAELSLNSATRAYEQQKETLEKNETLYAQGVISKSEYDAIAMAVVEAESALTQAKLSLERSKADNSLSKDSTSIDIEMQMMNLEVSALSIGKLEDQIAELQTLTEAPINGVVTSIAIEDGAIMPAMNPLMAITDVNQLQIIANVREYDVKSLDIGQTVYITGDAINDADTIVGEVSFIAPVAVKGIVSGREATAVEIHVDVTEGVQYLKPGYSTDCEIMTQEKTDVVIVNYNMLRENKDKKQTILVINEEGKAEERVLTLGIISDFDAEVIDGATAGELVIVNPSLAVKDGTKVKVTNDPDETNLVEGE